MDGGRPVGKALALKGMPSLKSRLKMQTWNSGPSPRLYYLLTHIQWPDYYCKGLIDVSKCKISLS